MLASLGGVSSKLHSQRIACGILLPKTGNVSCLGSFGTTPARSTHTMSSKFSLAHLPPASRTETYLYASIKVTLLEAFLHDIEGQILILRVFLDSKEANTAEGFEELVVITSIGQCFTGMLVDLKVIFVRHRLFVFGVGEEINPKRRLSPISGTRKVGLDPA